MKKKVMFLLIGIFFLINIYFVNAVTNVTGCEVLNVPNTIYTLNQSIGSGADGGCLIIANESIILDCAGYNITFGNSSGGVGIINMDSDTNEGYTNVTIRNCNIYENSTGLNATAIFFGVNSSSATIFNNTITTQGGETGGILLNTNLTSSNISSNTLTISGDSGIGMTVINGSDTSINLNTFTVSGNDGVGIAIMDGSSISMDSNDITISGNLSGGIYLIEGITDSNITSNNINLSVSNTENTTSILLFGGSNSNLLYNNTITTSGGGIIIGDSISTNISSNTIISSGSASDLNVVFLENANSSVVENNNITAVLMGIYVQGSPNTNVSSNNITNSGTEEEDTSMIRLEDSDGSIVDYNIIITSSERASGIAMEDVNNVLVNLNTITTSGEGAAGIYLNVSNDNTNITSNNIITNNTDSTGIFSTFSNSTLIFNNTIKTTGNSSNGIYILNLFNTISNNTLNTTNGYAIYVAGSTVTYYNHTIENNTEQGENILYLFNNDSGIVEDQTLGQLIVTNSTNITIDNVTVNYDGLTFVFTNNSFINNSNFTTSANNIHGIDFFESSYNNVTSCGIKTLTGDESCVIYFYNSSDYNVFYNNILNVTAENTLSGTGAGVCWETSAPANNIWNTTYNASITNILGHGIGGNFWTNSLGTGYSDNCTDADGDYICDDFYNVITNNFDYLPLADHTNAAFGCATLNTENKTYYLNQSISSNGTCFNITANNITLNFMNYNITGNTTGDGINISSYNDTTVKDGLIYNFSNGIFLNNSQNNNITNITLGNNNRSLYIDSSPSNVFSDITLNNSGQNCVYLNGTASSNNNFTDVMVDNSIAPYYDIEFGTEGINGTWIIDSLFTSYAFAGEGGIVNFKISGYAMVEFLEPINGSGTYLTLSDVDLDNNLLYVNSSSNSGLNKSAKITFYGITYTDPKPQYSLDNSVWTDCTASTDPSCNEVSYSGTTFVFNVSHFTYFRSAETTTSSTGDDDSSSSGGGYPTFRPTDEELKNGYTRTLYKNWKILFNVNNKSHTLNVEDIVGNSSKISISSETQEAVFSAGEEKKFELSGDDYYDLLVKLNSIDSNKASFTLQTIHEEKPESEDGEGLGEKIGTIFKEDSSLKWIIIVVIIILVGILLSKGKSLKRSSGKR